MYLAVCTRPDIAQAVGALARYMTSPTTIHWAAAIGVLRYLAGTKDYGICFGKDNATSQLSGYCDSDYAGDLDTRRSTTGYVFFFLFLIWKKPYMPANLANDSNTSRQIKETSRSIGCTAQPAPGEAASPWQAICTVQHDNLMGPPSRGGRIQSRMAPGMYHPCLNGRDTSKPRARRWPLTSSYSMEAPSPGQAGASKQSQHQRQRQSTWLRQPQPRRHYGCAS